MNGDVMFIKLTNPDTNKKIYYNFDYVKSMEEVRTITGDFKYTCLTLTHGTAIVKERAEAIYEELRCK